MRKLILGLIAIATANIGSAQLAVTTSGTVTNYVQNVLLGGGVSATNITFSGNPAQIGFFSGGLGGAPALGLDSGIVLSTGNVVDIPPGGNQPDVGQYAGPGDPDLLTIAQSVTTNPQSGLINSTADAAILEFDFTVQGDSLRFNFVFASEEYNTYINSQYNDAFAFFLSGPGITGPYASPAAFPGGAVNVALVPGTTDPITISTIYNDPFQTPPTMNAAYYINNQVGTNNDFNAFTTVIEANYNVICGQTYHFKFVIADCQDDYLDTGVFLEGGSFSTNITLDATNAVVPPDVTLCLPPYDVNFSAGPTPPPFSYWDFGDGMGTDTAANPMYTYADTGSYTVMYVAYDTAACVTADTAYFNVDILLNDSLDAQFTLPPPEPCADSMLVELAFTGTGADSLYWDMGNGSTFSNLDSVNYYYTNPGTYIITFEAYDTLCGQFFTMSDTVDFNPVFTTVTATAPPPISLCSSPYDVNFTGNVPSPPNSYWDFGDGLGTDTAANPMYTYADTGTYNVMYVVIDSSTCNVADTAYFNVMVNQQDTLDAQIVIPPYDPCTDSLTIQLDFTGSGADSLFWDMGNGTTFINDTAISYTFVTPGTYVITFDAWDFVCNNSASITDTVFFNPNITAVNAVPIDSIFSCTSLLVNFTGNTPAPPNSYWDFGDGSTSTQTNPSYTYAGPGTYNVMYVAIDSNTCNIADTLTFSVQLVQPPPFAATIDFVPPLPCETDSFFVDLEYTGTGEDSLLWDMGDGSVFTVDSVFYLYSDPGSYTITLTAFHSLCGDKSISSEVEFFEFEDIQGIIPNVFTPNGDGMNDVLEFSGIDPASEYSIKIYNRWGQKVYEGTDASTHWDGGGHGEGTYFYELVYTDVCSNEAKTVTGYVTLLLGK